MVEGEVRIEVKIEVRMEARANGKIGHGKIDGNVKLEKMDVMALLPISIPVKR